MTSVPGMMIAGYTILDPLSDAVSRLTWLSGHCKSRHLGTSLAAESVGYRSVAVVEADGD